MTIDHLRRLMTSVDDDIVGQAGCDLAQMIWNGEVDDTTLIGLLEDEYPSVRAGIAWAVADALRPEAGITWLINHGLYDECDRVRVWALSVIAESSISISRRRKDRVTELVNDESEIVRRLAQKVLEQWSDADNEDLQ